MKTPSMGVQSETQLKTIIRSSVLEPVGCCGKKVGLHERNIKGQKVHLAESQIVLMKINATN